MGGNGVLRSEESEGGCKRDSTPPIVHDHNPYARFPPSHFDFHVTISENLLLSVEISNAQGCFLDRHIILVEEVICAPIHFDPFK
jgi:hypothetical protein